MNVKEALDLLKQYDITHSEQVLRRWIRDGKIQASMPSKKEGYFIERDSLQAFIDSQRMLSIQQSQEYIQAKEEAERKLQFIREENAILRDRNAHLQQELEYYKRMFAYFEKDQSEE